MRILFCFLFVALALIACKDNKAPQVSLGDKDTEEVEEISEAESEDGYVNLGTVHCEYYDSTSEFYEEYKDATLYAKILSNDVVYYYVSLENGGKKYPVNKCDPYKNRNCNGKFLVDDVKYLVYIQTWDDTH